MDQLTISKLKGSSAFESDQGGNFSLYFTAAKALEDANRLSSAEALRAAAVEKLKSAFRSYSFGHSARFNAFPTELTPTEAHSTLTALAATLPTSNGATLSQRIPLTVGIITDLYMFNFYKDVFSKIVYLSPRNYEQALSENQFDVILYVSCWKGISNEEWRGIKFRERPAQAFATILKTAKRQGAVTIFQSIEDPSNFDNFLPLAREFDVVITSDAESIPRYRAECGHESVYYGEYGVNPLLQNPVGCRSHIFNAAFFAGSWAGRYQERCDDMRTIFSSIQKSGASLTIVDRNFGTKAEELKYPDEYQGSLLPSVDHELLQSLHKLFRYNVNFNSIKSSTTMCAMRVYELQAMGVGVLSNYARSVFNRFPEIRLLPYPSDLSFDFARDATFDEYMKNMRQLREVMTNLTAYDVTKRLLTNAGIRFPLDPEPRVAIICDELDAVVQRQVKSQSYPFCIVVSNEEATSPSRWSQVCDTHNIQYYTWFDPNCNYGPNYVQDMVNAFKYTASAFVTKHAWFSSGGYVDGPQHDFTSQIGGRARTLFSSRYSEPSHFSQLGYHESATCLEIGYAIDPFELEEAREKSKPPTKEASSYRLSVIVPVYNNGRFLLAKCMESLKRNRIWRDIEVILVDDGSSEQQTVEVVQALVDENPNIVGYFFNDGGSGTASRARNTGIHLARAPLVTFLDPDNEISPGGYDNLVAIFDEISATEDVDFVSGYHVKVEETAKIIGKHSSTRAHLVKGLKAAFLKNGKFPVIATQPAVIRRDLFERSALRFIEGAAGQDTLFGWELLCHARAGVFTDKANLIYYAERAGSMVNDIDSAYFNKKLALEKAQVAFLSREELLPVYIEKVYHRFLDGWYLPKLSLVTDPDEQKACHEILREIETLYVSHPDAKQR